MLKNIISRFSRLSPFVLFLCAITHVLIVIYSLVGNYSFFVAKGLTLIVLSILALLFLVTGVLKLMGNGLSKYFEIFALIAFIFVFIMRSCGFIENIYTGLYMYSKMRFRTFLSLITFIFIIVSFVLYLKSSVIKIKDIITIFLILSILFCIIDLIVRLVNGYTSIIYLIYIFLNLILIQGYFILEVNKD